MNNSWWITYWMNYWSPFLCLCENFLADDNFFQLMYYSNLLNHLLIYLFISMLIYCKQLPWYWAVPDFWHSNCGPQSHVAEFVSQLAEHNLYTEESTWKRRQRSLIFIERSSNWFEIPSNSLIFFPFWVTEALYEVSFLLGKRLMQDLLAVGRVQI